MTLNDVKPACDQLLVCTKTVFGQRALFHHAGHVGISFYFIVSGTVVVQREEKDPRTNEKHVQVYFLRSNHVYSLKEARNHICRWQSF